MLDDQGGDIKETAALCRKMKRQERAVAQAERSRLKKASAA